MRWRPFSSSATRSMSWPCTAPSAPRSSRASALIWSLTRLGLLPDVELGPRLLAEFLECAAGGSRATLPQVPLLAEHLQLNFLASNRLIPLSEDGETIVVATADPFNTDPIAAIGFLLGRPVEGAPDGRQHRRACHPGDLTAAPAPWDREQEAGAGQASDEDVRCLRIWRAKPPSSGSHTT